jgi:hypothetical protein
MTKLELQKLKPLIEKELTFNEDSIQSKLQELVIKRCFYLDIFTKETTKLKDLRLDKEVLYAELYDKIKFHSDIRREKRDEIESQMHKDPRFFNICKEINFQEEVVIYLENTLQNFRDLGFQIKNSIAHMRFKAGLDF